MQKILTDIRMVAALLMASATLAACSSEDNITNEQPVQPTEHVYTMTVSAAKGGDATTRALSLDGKTLNATWAEGEEVTVYNNTKEALLGGTLKAQTSGANTTLKGELTGTIEAGDQLTLRFNSANYASQDGTLDYIAANCDYAEATVTVASVADGNITVTEAAADFQNRQAIVKFTLKDQDGNDINVSKLTISAESNRLVSTGGLRGSGAKTYYTGYTVDAGTGNTGVNGGYDQLLNGNIDTKWCVNKDTKSDGVWFVEFHTASAVQVDGYKLTTAEDTQDYSGRNPKNWTLKAKANSGDAWAVIDTKTGNTDMPAANHSSVDFDTDVIGGMYQYFRLEVSAVQSDDWFQLSEMQLFGCSERGFSFRYGDVNVTPAAATNELTVALNNQRGAPDTYTLTAIGDSYDYTYTKSGVTFESGKYYAITVKMTKVVRWLSSATPADYGMVVCAAGHLHKAKTAVPDGCTGVGILGKVTETGHGLILSLQEDTKKLSYFQIIYNSDAASYAGTTLRVLQSGCHTLTNYTKLGSTVVSGWAVAPIYDYEAIFINLGSTRRAQRGTGYGDNLNDYLTTGVGGAQLEGIFWSATGDDENSSNAFYFCRGWWASDEGTEILSIRPVLGF